MEGVCCEVHKGYFEKLFFNASIKDFLYTNLINIYMFNFFILGKCKRPAILYPMCTLYNT